MKLSENFDDQEFACPCCGVIKIEPKLVDHLQNLRDKIGKPIIITSGYRCRKHHIEIYKKRYGIYWEDYITWKSPHLDGKAADYYCPEITLSQLWLFSEKNDFNGLGSYPEERPQIIHGDIANRYSRWVLRGKEYIYLF